MAMETSSSFTARRQATQALPPFHLPSTNQDIPIAIIVASPRDGYAVGSLLLLRCLKYSTFSCNRQLWSNIAFRSASSYYPGGNGHGSWPTPSSSYQLSSGTPQGLVQTSQYASRGSTYDQQSPMSYSRTSQSPATGEGLPPPPYGQTHQSFQAYPHGGAGSTPVSLPSQGPPTPQGGILGSHGAVSTQPPTPGGLHSHLDSYTQSRPPATPGYYSTSSAPQQSFNTYQQSHTSPTAPSPTTSVGPGRGLAALQHPSAMAPPGSYRYPGYHVPSMGGPIMSNLTSPGHQMSLRHRLVKGCGSKEGDGQNENGRRSSQDHSDDGTPPLKRE
ncbi:hypothetical protein JMJ78_0009452 [Colletotrichum scovillei]|nr:hypothetical protein JMJ78_0009452 [Colletotrichum scovillei]